LYTGNGSKYIPLFFTPDFDIIFVYVKMMDNFNKSLPRLYGVYNIQVKIRG